MSTTNDSKFNMKIFFQRNIKKNFNLKVICDNEKPQKQRQTKRVKYSL